MPSKLGLNRRRAPDRGAAEYLVRRKNFKRTFFSSSQTGQRLRKARRRWIFFCLPSQLESFASPPSNHGLEVPVSPERRLRALSRRAWNGWFLVEPFKCEGRRAHAIESCSAPTASANAKKSPALNAKKNSPSAPRRHPPPTRILQAVSYPIRTVDTGGAHRIVRGPDIANSVYGNAPCVKCIRLVAG